MVSGVWIVIFNKKNDVLDKIISFAGTFKMK